MNKMTARVVIQVPISKSIDQIIHGQVFGINQTKSRVSFVFRFKLRRKRRMKERKREREKTDVYLHSHG